MQHRNTTSVVAFRPKNETSPESPAKIDIVAEALSAARVQLRLPLSSLDQAEVALELLRSATEESLAQIRRARRRQDPAALITVRALLEKANRLVNARHQGR